MNIVKYLNKYEILWEPVTYDEEKYLHLPMDTWLKTMIIAIYLKKLLKIVKRILIN